MLGSVCVTILLGGTRVSKLNKTLAAKKSAQSRMSRSGCYSVGSYSADKGGAETVNSGKSLTNYELGCQDWQNDTPINTAWHLHRQQGWKKERDRDIIFATKCPSARARVERRLGIAA